MSKTTSTGDLVATVQKIKSETKNFEPYISYIQFPHYKNLSRGERIDFDFPLTMLVGQNGCNKSSVLQALYGCPKGKSTGDYWFSTAVDRIDGYNRYFYGYWHEEIAETVECIKTRMTKKGKLDYWETARPRKGDGMKSMPKSAQSARWEPIQKDVLYIDFRDNLGAYDKYFYHGKFVGTGTLKTKQDRIRKWSKQLNQYAITENRRGKIIWKKERIIKNEVLTNEMIKTISFILGKEYGSIRIVEHVFFDDMRAFSTFICDRKTHTYSEAFAGSGETSVALFVYEVMKANRKSLILLDEPETSLHPGALYRIKQFLLEQIKINKHQVVISTHSPILLEGLPAQAVKLMYENPANGKIIISQNIIPEEAFAKLGQHLRVDIVEIRVEDRLAQAILQDLLEKTHPELTDFFNIDFLPGGVDSIKTKYIPSFALSGSRNTVFFLDGDAKGKKDRVKSDTIPESENDKLGEHIKEIVGSLIPFSPDGGKGGKDKKKLYEIQRSFLDYWYEAVYFLPCDMPEELIYNMLDESKQKEYFQSFDKEKAKACFEAAAKKFWKKERVDGNEIFMFEKKIIAEMNVKSALAIQIENALLDIHEKTKNRNSDKN